MPWDVSVSPWTLAVPREQTHAVRRTCRRSRTRAWRLNASAKQHESMCEQISLSQCRQNAVGVAGRERRALARWQMPSTLHLEHRRLRLRTPSHGAGPVDEPVPALVDVEKRFLLAQASRRVTRSPTMATQRYDVDTKITAE